MIADEPQAFADAVLTLLRDTTARRRMESSARSLVVQNYDWSAVAGELDEALRICAGRAKPTRPRRTTGVARAKGRRHRASA